MASTSLTQDLESQFSIVLGFDVVNTADENDFQRTIELLQIDTEELSNEIWHSAEEVSHYNLYIFYLIGVKCVEHNLFILCLF